MKIASYSPFELLDVLVIERTETTFRASENFITIPTGKQEVSIPMRSYEVKKDGSEIGDRPEMLAVRLTKEGGLTKPEAESLVKIWRDGFFKRAGITLIYRVPQTTYDAWLPLEAKPAPKKIVRVGLVVHEHVKPELEARVTALLKQMTAENFEVRDQARKALVEIGGAAFPQLEAAMKGDDPELRESAKTIISALDTRPGLDAQPKTGRGVGGGGW